MPSKNNNQNQFSFFSKDLKNKKDLEDLKECLKVKAEDIQKLMQSCDEKSEDIRMQIQDFGKKISELQDVLNDSPLISKIILYGNVKVLIKECLGEIEESERNIKKIVDIFKDIPEQTAIAEVKLS